MTEHIEQTAHGSRLRRVQKLRKRTERAANFMLRWSLGLAIASFVFFILLPSLRGVGIRLFGVFFAIGVSGYLAQSALDTAEAWLKGDRRTAVWMFAWTGIQGFIVYIGLIILIVGLQHHR